MQKRPLDMENLHLYQDLMVTIIQSRATMDTACARADLLQNVFIISVEHLGSEQSYVDRAMNYLELDLLDARDAPERLRDATADAARAIWAYRMNPTSVTNQNARDAFERWEVVYRQTIGEQPAETHMDIENARCLAEEDYYSERPMPFVSRVAEKKLNQN